MFGISTPHTGKRVAVADVGSGSAGVAIVSLAKGKPAHILASHRAVLPFEERTPDATLSGIVAALSESAEKAVAEGGAKTGAAQKSYAVIRAPWVRSKTIRVEKKFQKEEKVTGQMIAEIAKEALGSEKELDRSKLIEANVIRVELNGYPTARPEGKHAHSITVAVLASECEPRIKKSTEETLLRISGVPPTFRSGTGALLSILRKGSTEHPDYLVVDVAGTATAMFAVHKGEPLEHVLVPEGTRTILKRIAGEKLPEETLTMMRMVSRDQCEDSACEEVKAGMARAEQELIRAFGEAMAKLAATRKLPNSLILLAENDMADWLSNFFSRIDFTQFTLTTQPFSIEMLSQADLEESVTIPEKGKAGDVSLLTAIALVNSEMNGVRAL